MNKKKKDNKIEAKISNDKNKVKNTQKDIDISKEDLKKIMQLSTLMLEKDKKIQDLQNKIEKQQQTLERQSDIVSLFKDKNTFLNNKINRLEKFFTDQSIKNIYNLINELKMYTIHFSKFCKDRAKLKGDEIKIVSSIVKFIRKLVDEFLIQENFKLIVPKKDDQIDLKHMVIMGVKDEKDRIIENFDYHTNESNCVVSDFCTCALINVKDMSVLYKARVTAKLINKQKQNKKNKK